MDKIFDTGMVEAIQKPIKSARLDDLVKKYYKRVAVWDKIILYGQQRSCLLLKRSKEY